MALRIERDLVLDADIEDVWAAVTGDGWLADEVLLDLRPGGDAEFSSEKAVKSGWIEEALAPSRLTFWWAGNDQPASRVELTLEQDGDGYTRLHVIETQPLEVLDLIGIPLSRFAGRSYGPALVAA